MFKMQFLNKSNKKILLVLYYIGLMLSTEHCTFTFLKILPKYILQAYN